METFLTTISLGMHYGVLSFGVVLLVIYPVLFFAQNAKTFQVVYPLLSDGQYRKLIYPAIALNTLFEKFIFGPKTERKFWFLSWRSLTTTFAFSGIANLICIFLLLAHMPDDMPASNRQADRIFVYSYFFFLLFNFLGDFVSISFTRHVLSKIIKGRCNFFKYLILDLFGILAGYLVTLSPTLFFIIYCFNTGEAINQFAHNGFLGNGLIPFFLLIFVTSGLSWPLSIFALVSVFSVTIPTVCYLLFISFTYIGYRASIIIRRELKKEFSDLLISLIRWIGNTAKWFLKYLIPGVAITAIIQAIHQLIS